MTLVKLLTIAILLSCVSCLASAGAEHVPAGGLGGGEGGAPQRAVPGMETSEKPRSQPDAIPLGTEFPPGELSGENGRWSKNGSRQQLARKRTKGDR